MASKSAKLRCVICGKPLRGCGCDAMPVAKGRCCERCDDLVVTPARISKATGVPVAKLMDWAEHVHTLSRFYKVFHAPHKKGNGE
jgi:hypothetical protein